MRILAARSRRSRRILLVGLMVIVATSAGMAGVNSGLGTAGAVLLLGSALAVLAKGASELVSEIDRVAADSLWNTSRIETEVRATEHEYRIQSERTNSRLDAFSRQHASQDDFNNAVISRVRTIEHQIRRSHGGRRVSVEPGRDEASARAGQARRVHSALERIQLAVERLPDLPPPDPLVPSVNPNQQSDAQIAVVVTCFNQERYVADAIRSVQQQSYANLECIVVDDGSSDGSVGAIERAAGGDSRIRLLPLDRNLGAVQARNIGLANVAAAYVAFLDGDDLMLRESLADRWIALRGSSDPDVVGAYTSFRIGDRDTQLNELPERYLVGAQPEFVDFVSAAGECPFGTPGPLLRTEVFRRLGGWSADVRIAEDWQTWVRLLRAGFVFVPASSCTILYRQLRDSGAQQGALAHVEEANELIRSAFAPDDMTGAPVAGSMRFDQPLWHYQVILTQARRSVQYASMALLNGDEAAFRGILETLRPGTLPLLRRHLNLSRHIEDGFRRAAGLSADDLPILREEMGPLVRWILAAVQDAAH